MATYIHDKSKQSLAGKREIKRGTAYCPYCHGKEGHIVYLTTVNGRPGLHLWCQTCQRRHHFTPLKRQRDERGERIQALQNEIWFFVQSNFERIILHNPAPRLTLKVGKLGRSSLKGKSYTSSDLHPELLPEFSAAWRKERQETNYALQTE